MNKNTLEKFKSMGGNFHVIASYAEQMRDENIILKIRIEKFKNALEKANQLKLPL